MAVPDKGISLSAVVTLVAIGSVCAVGISLVSKATGSEAIGGVLGVLCAVVFGALYGRRGGSWGSVAGAGAVIGLLCSACGIGSGLLMGNHPPVFAIGLGAVWGAVGGCIGRALAPKGAASGV